MDLCGPMRVASVNGKKYILVIVDDYSRFTWVKCLRSKDEAPDFIIKFLKMIQVRLKVPVRQIRTYNGTEFVNQTLREYYEKKQLLPHVIPKIVPSSGIKAVNTAKPKDTHNFVKRNRFNTVKASMDAHDQGRQECSKEKEESKEECSKSRKSKKMKLLNQSVNTARITAAGEKVNAAESLLVVSTERLVVSCVLYIITVSLINTSRVSKCRFRIHFDIQTKSQPLLFWIHPRRYHQEELYIHKEEKAPMASSESEVKTCSKSCQKDYEDLKKKYDDLLVKLDDTGFKAYTYKRGLSILEAQVVKYKESEVLFSEEIALLKRSVGHKDYLMGLVKTELEKVKEEKEGFEFKLAKFEKSSKDLDALLASQVTDKSKKGFGYNVVPSPHPLILNRPTPLDLSYSGLAEFAQPEINEYGPRDSSLKSTTVCDRESNNSKENTDDSLTQQPKTVSATSSVKTPLKADKAWKEKLFHPANHVRIDEPKKARENSDAPIIEDWVSDDEEDVESIPKEEKKTDVPTATEIESVKTVKPVRKPVRYAEMYRSQKPRGNQRNWNNQKSQQLGSDFVMNNKACYICGSFDHLQYTCKHKRHVNDQKQVKPVWNNSKRVIHHYSTRMTHSNPRRNMIPQLVLMRSGIKAVNTAKPKDAHNAVKRNRFNAVKESACWVWMPKNRVVDHVSKNISASVTLKRLDYIDAQGRFKSMDAQTQGRQECSKEKEESREECSKSRKTKKMKWEDCWELNTSELVLPRDELVLLSQQLVLLEENSSYCSRLQLPVLNQSVNTARITAVGEKVNAAESLLVSTEVNAD
ncbi:ribonuclease H-like domain-containing protein [Tanacetum coccineum]